MLLAVFDQLVGRNELLNRKSSGARQWMCLQQTLLGLHVAFRHTSAYLISVPVLPNSGAITDSVGHSFRHQNSTDGCVSPAKSFGYGLDIRLQRQFEQLTPHDVNLRTAAPSPNDSHACIVPIPKEQDMFNNHDTGILGFSGLTAHSRHDLKKINLVDVGTDNTN